MVNLFVVAHSQNSKFGHEMKQNDNGGGEKSPLRKQKKIRAHTLTHTKYIY